MEYLRLDTEAILGDRLRDKGVLEALWKDSTLSLIIQWGVLHYDDLDPRLERFADNVVVIGRNEDLDSEDVAGVEIELAVRKTAAAAVGTFEDRHVHTAVVAAHPRSIHDSAKDEDRFDHQHHPFVVDILGKLYSPRNIAPTDDANRFSALLTS